jgi:ketosteroid isomerase-like protein
MSEQDVSTVRGAYDSFNAGNPQGVIGILGDDVAWTEPGGGNSASGTFNGPDAVAKDVLSIVPENFDEFSVDAEDFKDEGDTVVVSGRFKGKSKSGKELDTPFEHTWKMSDGKVTSMNNNVPDKDAWTEAWS